MGGEGVQKDFECERERIWRKKKKELAEENAFENEIGKSIYQILMFEDGEPVLCLEVAGTTKK